MSINEILIGAIRMKAEMEKRIVELKSLIEKNAQNNSDLDKKLQQTVAHHNFLSGSLRETENLLAKIFEQEISSRKYANEEGEEPKDAA